MRGSFAIGAAMEEDYCMTADRRSSSHHVDGIFTEGELPFDD